MAIHSDSYLSGRIGCAVPDRFASTKMWTAPHALPGVKPSILQHIPPRD